MTSPVRLRAGLRAWAERLERAALTLWFAYRQPQAPLGARLLGAFALAYLPSPIDLIPDPIPIIGYLDDLLPLAGLICLVLRMVPANVLEESRARGSVALRAARAAAQRGWRSAGCRPVAAVPVAHVGVRHMAVGAAARLTTVSPARAWRVIRHCRRV
jgi:uncharacterized membrane protein YkvA (DUF1232 family)